MPRAGLLATRLCLESKSKQGTFQAGIDCTPFELCLESKSKQGTFLHHGDCQETKLCLESKSKQGTLRRWLCTGSPRFALSPNQSRAHSVIDATDQSWGFALSPNQSRAHFWSQVAAP